MLVAQRISVCLGGKCLLNEVSLSLRPGEVLAMVGPNGAGKSTLFKALCGDVALAAGVITLNQRPLAHWRLRDLAQIRSVLPQQSALTFPLTAKEVVLIGRNPHYRSQPDAKDHAISQQAMVFTETEHLCDQRYTTLSGGERQRVHLARVLAQIWESATGEARYLLLDEPTSALDLAHQHRTLAIARHFAKQQGVGVLAILHDLNLAAQYADRIALLQAGRLMAVDTPSQVLKESIIQQIFGYPVLVTRHPGNDECPVIIPHRHVLLSDFSW